MRRTAVLAACAALAFAAACGGDDEPEATPAPTEEAAQAPTQAPTEAPTQAPTEAPTEAGPAAVPTEGATEAASPADGAELQIFADPGGANAFTETELPTGAGKTTIVFSNQSSTPHAVEIEGVPGSATETVTGADAPPVTVTLEPGEYTYFCPVGNHRADGMEGKLVVR
jgi:plastocyanin